MSTPTPHIGDSVVLLGAGGHAAVAAATARRMGVTIRAVLDRDPARTNAELGGVSIGLDDGDRTGAFHAAVGDNALRRRMVEARECVDWVSLIDPAALIGDGVGMGKGCLIGMGALIQTRAKLGRHVIVNTGAVIEHDCRIGDFCHVAPGAILTGAVQLGEGVLIGAGAVVLPGVTIGDRATVGAGAVVRSDVAPGDTVVGVPARRLAQ